MAEPAKQMTQAAQVSLKTKLKRGILRSSIRLIFRFLSNVRITGKKNIPKTGAYLIAMNHVSIFDPPFLMSFWPKAAEALAAIDIWSKPGQSFIVENYDAIPVHRGAYDRLAMDRMISALNAGRPLVIAPEGGRSHIPGMRRGQPGIAYLADQVDVPILPVGITGTTDDFFDRAIHGHRPRLIMNIGQPFRLPPIQGSGAERRAARQQNVDQILYAVAALLPAEYRGVYGESSLAAIE